MRVDILAVDALDHVTRLDAGRQRRAVRCDLGDQGARGSQPSDMLSASSSRHRLDLHSEQAALDPPLVLQLGDHRLGQARGDGEAKADAAAGRREDRGVDADDLAVHVEQRAARVAAVDGGVGLDVVVERTGVDVAAARRHDAGGHGAAQAERIADRHHRLADAHLGGVAELDVRQRLVALDLEHREVGLLVAAQQLGRELAAVGQGDGDLLGLAGDVVVGDDEADGSMMKPVPTACAFGECAAHLRLPGWPCWPKRSAKCRMNSSICDCCCERSDMRVSSSSRGAGLHGDGDVDDRRASPWRRGRRNRGAASPAMAGGAVSMGTMRAGAVSAVVSARAARRSWSSS